MDLWLGGRPTAKREVGKFRDKLTEEWTERIKQAAGVNDLEDLFGGRMRVWVETDIVGIRISNLTISDYASNEGPCEPPWPPECTCQSESWLESYTLEVRFEIYLVRVPINAPPRRTLQGSHREEFSVSSEPHARVAIDCHGLDDLELPESYAALMPGTGGSDSIGAVWSEVAMLGFMAPGTFRLPLPAGITIVQPTHGDDGDVRVEHLFLEERFHSVPSDPQADFEGGVKSVSRMLRRDLGTILTRILGSRAKEQRGPKA